MKTTPRGKEHFVIQARHEKTLRVAAYLRALQSGKEPEIPQSEILKDMIYLIEDWASGMGWRLHTARRSVEDLIDSTESVHEDRVLSPRFEDLDEMEAEVNKILQRARGIKGAADFQEMRSVLEVKDMAFSSRIIALTRPLEIPD
ncbi:hypothetical protein [Streptomyces sp. NPDC056399]|uniref:hypothetical protein n=1 Tax=Streptomyces sp. NPDC056399 TaxID=3345807 RepID=UPI0035DB5501